jgi:hypothetical protein
MVPEVSRLPVDMLSQILYDKTKDVGKKCGLIEFAVIPNNPTYQIQPFQRIYLRCDYFKEIFVQMLFCHIAVHTSKNITHKLCFNFKKPVFTNRQTL